MDNVPGVMMGGIAGRFTRMFHISVRDSAIPPRMNSDFFSLKKSRKMNTILMN